MPKLHLVGITPDHRGLVLSEHARAKRGDMVLEIDDRLLEAIDKAQRLRTQDEGHRLESNALPSKRDTINGDSAVAARLTPREIQARLRAGETIAALARSSGTDEAWIRRFAAPVLAEQARIIEQARTATYTKRGVGRSGAPLGPAVAANVIDRGVALTLPDLEAGWGAYQHPEGGWHVRFTFPWRGRRQTAEWEIDVATGDLAARNKLAVELGWREPGKKLPQPKPAKAPPAKRPAATKEAPAGPPPAVEPATEVAPATPEETAAEAGHTVQALPLSEQADGLSPGEGREVSTRKPRKSPAAPKAASGEATSPAKPAGTRSAATKRAAAAVTEIPVQSVVPVPVVEPEADPATPGGDAADDGPSRPAGSMPPTDLDAVDVVVDLRDDDTAREPAPIGNPTAPAGGPPAS